MKRLCAFAALFLVASAPSYAASIGARVAVSQINTNTKETFDAYELFAVFDLPWSWQRPTSRIQTQLEVTGADLKGGGTDGFLGTIGPRIAFIGHRVSFDVGVGFAGVGKNEFGRQEFGGAFQFTAQAGLDIALSRRLNIGARIRHMSDGGLHNPPGGEDLNLVFVELAYNINSARP